MAENIHFFIRHKKLSKRTDIQENEFKPIYEPSSPSIKGWEGIDFIYGFPSFTIPKTQQTIIEVNEQTGGRTLIFPINYKTILKARLLKTDHTTQKNISWKKKHWALTKAN